MVNKDEWENGQRRRFMHNSCYITLCSSKKREEAIIRDTKAREATKKMPTSTSQSPIHCFPSDLPITKTSTVINKIHS